MPHCKIEVTKGLLNNINPQELMEEVSKALNTDKIFVSNDIKLRIYEIEHSFMGEIKQDHSYVSAEIIILNNKTNLQKERLLDEVQKVLVDFFQNNTDKQSITCRLNLMQPDYYRRHVNY